MAENENITQEQTTAPAPEATEPAPPQPAELNLDSKVTFEGKEVSVGELIQQNQKIGELEEYQKNASMLMTNETPAPQRESAMRFIMSKQGYSPDQIDQHIDATREMTNEMNQEQQPQQNDSNEAEMAMARERARIAEMEARQSRMGVDMLRRDLESAVSDTMGNNTKIQTLLRRSKELVGEDGYDKRVSSIQEEVRRATMDNLQSRKSRGETFDSSWFNQETNKAADAVYERIRSVIGDPDKIQRAPETASETDSFVNNPPVPLPNFEKGDNMGSATTKSHDWTTDTLSRLATDVSQGGESKI